MFDGTWSGELCVCVCVCMFLELLPFSGWLNQKPNINKHIVGASITHLGVEAGVDGSESSYGDT